MTPRTRFAPSPTGRLHAGHALSALEVWGWAAANKAEALLRIEDIDITRCRPEYEKAILEDLAWLGLRWPEPVWRQSKRTSHYQEALDRIRHQGLLYPCFCTRKEVARNASAEGHEGPIYAGTCRHIGAPEAQQKIAAGEPAAWRLKTDKALAKAGEITWHDELAGAQAWDGKGWGDVVLGRKDIGVSYHVAVTADDAAQGITTVVRGMDLFHTTHIHVLLQKLFGWHVPGYRHHALLENDQGIKLSKRSRDISLRQIAEEFGGRIALFQALRNSGAASSLFDHLGTVTD